MAPAKPPRGYKGQRVACTVDAAGKELGKAGGLEPGGLFTWNCLSLSWSLVGVAHLCLPDK